MLCNKCKNALPLCSCSVWRTAGNEKRGLLPFPARELGIKPLDDIMKQFGISGEDLEAMEDRFAGMMENGDMDPSEMMQNMMGMGAEDAEDAGQDEEEETSDNGKSALCRAARARFHWVFCLPQKEEGEKKDPRAREKGKKRKFLTITARTSPKKRATASWTPSLGATGRFTAPFRFSRAAKEQPLPDWRGGRGQNSHCRGHCVAHCRRRGTCGLKDKEIYLLDLTSLVAGTQFRGQFESREGP